MIKKQEEEKEKKEEKKEKKEEKKEAKEQERIFVSLFAGLWCNALCLCL